MEDNSMMSDGWYELENNQESSGDDGNEVHDNSKLIMAFV